jgi:RNA polymerase sigma-70 factor (ECF subfamily)
MNIQFRVVGLMSSQSLRLARQTTTAALAVGSTFPVAGKDTGCDAVTYDAKAGEERARRFRDAALPCLDDAYRLAHFLLRHRADAEDAVQECYLRAQRHFDGLRGSAIKPWLFAILRNVCYAELARRNRREIAADIADFENTAEEPLWQQPEATPESVMQSSQDGAAIRRLIAALPAPFRETIVLRELDGMSYQEIAEVAGVPVGTVMSRLARARAMLLAAWKAQHGPTAGHHPESGATPAVAEKSADGSMPIPLRPNGTARQGTAARRPKGPP